MAEYFQNNHTTNLDPPPTIEYDNIITLGTLVLPQIEIGDSPYVCIVRYIIEQDHTTSPYTPR